MRQYKQGRSSRGSSCCDHTLAPPYAMADKDKVPPATDLTRWRLSVAKGRQTWRYIDEEEAENDTITFLEKHFLGINKQVIN